MTDGTRIDKWLWAVRLCKTRGDAANLCDAGKIKRNGRTAKPAATVTPGDLLDVPFPEGPGARALRVVAVISQRVGAPEARDCYLDLTPEAVFEAQREWAAGRREGHKGRPTKRERRKLEHIHWFHEG